MQYSSRLIPKYAIGNLNHTMIPCPSIYTHRNILKTICMHKNNSCVFPKRVNANIKEKQKLGRTIETDICYFIGLILIALGAAAFFYYENLNSFRIHPYQIYANPFVNLGVISILVGIYLSARQKPPT